MIQRYTRLTATLDRADWLLPTLARVVFVGVLLLYFWVSALTKLGDGVGGWCGCRTPPMCRCSPRRSKR